MKLYSPATVRQIIEKHKFRFQKSLGQNFLIDGNTVNRIVQTADLNEEDVVLEIGAGIGTLTRALAEKAARVVVIEIDRNLVPVLGETLAGCTNVDVFSGNALKTDFDALISEKTAGRYGKPGATYKVVANLPYYITTPLIMHALENHFNVGMMVIMVQKEVAERMTAVPGGKDYGALTLAVNFYTEPKIAFRVPKNVFMPPPDVESAVVRLRRREKPPAYIEDETTFFKTVRAAFGQRRKTLANALSTLEESRDKGWVTGLLTGIGIDPGRRGETLSFEEFALVANAIYLYPD